MGAKGTSGRASRRQEEAHHDHMVRCQEVPIEPFLLFPVPSLSPDPLLAEAGEGAETFLQFFFTFFPSQSQLLPAAANELNDDERE